MHIPLYPTVGGGSSEAILAQQAPGGGANYGEEAAPGRPRRTEEFVVTPLFAIGTTDANGVARFNLTGPQKLGAFVLRWEGFEGAHVLHQVPGRTAESLHLAFPTFYPVCLVRCTAGPSPHPAQPPGTAPTSPALSYARTFPWCPARPASCASTTPLRRALL